MKFRSFLLIVLSLLSTRAIGQSYDLQQLLKENKFKLEPPRPYVFEDNGKKVIALTGVAWLKGVEFSTGTIEVDLRGKDIFQQSFLGIAFHGVDSATYDAVYFRPFNFRSDDAQRKIHAVQYMTHPDFPWDKLRKEQNGIYEKAVTPAPLATDWFHARIDVTRDEIIVYVNNSPTPSLKVKKLNNRQTGKIGLWNDGLDGNFANLVINK